MESHKRTGAVEQHYPRIARADVSVDVINVDGAKHVHCSVLKRVACVVIIVLAIIREHRVRMQLRHAHRKRTNIRQVTVLLNAFKHLRADQTM